MRTHSTPGLVSRTSDTTTYQTLEDCRMHYRILTASMVRRTLP
jgi:hypothetical protein